MIRLSDRRSRRPGLATTLLLALLSVSLVAAPGCQKKKKKPPPPPPPPPVVEAPPEKIDVAALMQELHPDARVQFPQEAAPVSRELATGAIRLADALAKGDTGALERMLAPRDRGILQDLRETGQFDEAAKKIEAVRIVYVSEGESGGGEEATTGVAEMSPEQMQELMKNMQKTGYQAGFDAAQDPATRDKIREIVEKGGDIQANIKAFMESPEGAEFKKKMESALSSTMASMGTGVAGGSVITLAIQEPGESYALAWSARKAGEGWRFSALPSESGTKPRASEWDGRSAVVGFTPDKPEVQASDGGRPDMGGGGGSGSGSGSNSPSSAPPPSAPPSSPGPIRKNTPGGPVNIPGGG